jgi:hypothetical protein
MEVKFKFELGDFVISKALFESYKTEVYGMQPSRLAEYRIGAPRVMLVSQREAEECPGGVQYHYNCREWSQGNTDSKIIRFNEIELQKWNREDFIKEFTAAAAEALAKQTGK